ncbi:MAG: Crp/Fnr family transcriptional regulator [Clostridiaceae bacterium]|nr:Crp/Fnr family transcriptional regulator [Clostridiaceae bacterium]
MPLREYLPFWNKLTDNQRQTLLNAAASRTVHKGELLHSGSSDCVGLLVVKEGQLREYVLSDEGKELTLYRLLPPDICLLSASCLMPSIQFDVFVEAEKDSEIFLIPSEVWRSLMHQSLEVSNYTLELMGERFSDVMWLMDQVLYRRMDARLSAFLLEESVLSGSDEMELTHETIARHLGTAREVITRMLKYLHNLGAVALQRGGVRILDREKLIKLAEGSLR